MVNLKLLRIGVIAPRHSKIAQNKLRKEGKIKSNECDQGSKLPDFFGVQTASNFWPPIVQSSHKTQNHATHHDIVEMRDNKISVMHVNIKTQCGKKKARQTANGEEPDETERIKHRRF